MSAYLARCFISSGGGGEPMPRRKLECPRVHTTIRLSQENDGWLNRESTTTGWSRSDIVNLALENMRDEDRIKELLREVLKEELGK